jgi:hypothetical protein
MNKEISIVGKKYSTDELRQILDFSVQNEFVTKNRDDLLNADRLRDGQVIVDDADIIVAKRIDYEVDGQQRSYFAFLLGYDDSGRPIVEPTVDDLPEDMRENIYKKRWELVNNRSKVEIDYMGIRSSVALELLVSPESYGSGSLVNNEELRRLAIEQGAFRPFPSNR